MPTHFPLRRWFSGRTQCLRPLTPSMRRLTILLGVLAGAQLLFLFWLNLTQLRYHLGYDASCDYLRAAEMYRQGKLFPDHWRDTTTSHLDSPVPLAALFLHFTPDLFTAYGLANCVFLGALVLFFWLILREMELALWARFLGISLLLCPNFVVVINANHLGYASCLLTSMQSYSGKFVLAFWFVWLWLSLAKRKPLRPGKIVALAACAAGYFVTGLSSGYFLAAYLLLPALLTSLLLWLVREDRRWLLGGHTALTIGMAAALVAGKLFAEHVLAFVSKDSKMELIPIGQLARKHAGFCGASEPKRAAPVACAGAGCRLCPLPAGAHRGCRRSLYRHPYPNGADGCDQQHGRFAAFSGCVHLHGHRRVQPDDAQHALLRSFPCV